MILDLLELLTQRVQRIPFSFEQTVTQEDGLPCGEFKAPLQVSGAAEERADILWLRLEVRGVYCDGCARCAEAVELPLSFDLRLRLVEESAAEGEEDEAVYTGTRLDLAEQVRQAVLLMLPSKLLCKEDCAGLCPRCGADLNRGPCGCGGKQTDPRWAVLSALLTEDA